MVLHLTLEHVDAIRQHGERSFPQECCGLLLGDLKERGGETHKLIREVWSIENAWDSAENPLDDGEAIERRFLIDPQAFKRGFDYARSKKLGIVGTYHSHPNHPSIPSEFDRQHAFPWGYSCVIVSVMDGSARDVRSWVLDESDCPEPEAIELVSQDSATSTDAVEAETMAIA
ncbi:MAG: M67 family metallopeptidase [Cyanobacteria bacterium P01_E01_bin.48]